MGGNNSKEPNWDIEVRKKVSLKTTDKAVLKSQVDDYPEDPANSVHYAIYLAQAEKNYAEAEEYFNYALKVDKYNSIAYGPYALYLEVAKRDNERAEEMYEKGYHEICKKQIIEEHDAHLLCNYAMFLKNVKNNPLRAETVYKKLLASQPGHGIGHGNYGLFLKNVNHDMEKADHHFKRAIECEPNDPHWLYVYANFLKKVKKDPAGNKEYLKKAKELEEKKGKKASNN